MNEDTRDIVNQIDELVDLCDNKFGEIREILKMLSALSENDFQPESCGFTLNGTNAELLTWAKGLFQIIKYRGFTLNVSSSGVENLIIRLDEWPSQEDGETLLRLLKI